LSNQHDAERDILVSYSGMELRSEKTFQNASFSHQGSVPDREPEVPSRVNMAPIVKITKSTNYEREEKYMEY
jgi:hypothetical protein